MRVVTFACQKGAAGKTTLAGHIGVQAELAGAGPVVLLDTDPQGALADWWNARPPERPAFAQPAIETIERDIERLRDLGFQHCVVDSASAVTPAVEQVIAVSDLVVIPCRPSPHDLRAATATIDMAQRLGKPFVFVLNGATAGESITDEAVRVLAEVGAVAPTIIENRTDFAESMFDGLTVMEVAPDGESAAEIGALWGFVAETLEDSAATPGPASPSAIGGAAGH